MDALRSARDTGSDPELEERTQRMLRRLDARIDADIQQRHRIRRVFSWSGMAAAVLVAAVLVWKGGGRTPAAEEAYTCENHTGTVMQVTLPDGSTGILRNGAELSYRQEGGVRSVSLAGDAYFDVKRDTLAPFVVFTDAISVKVLGTSFSVSAPRGGARADIILERGSVRLVGKDGSPLVRMAPNQRATFDAATGDLEVEQVFATPEIQRQYSIVSLDNAGIEEIVSAVESVYGIDVRYSGCDLSKQYHFSFLRSDSPGQVLAVLELLTGGKFSSVSSAEK